MNPHVQTVQNMYGKGGREFGLFDEENVSKFIRIMYPGESAMYRALNICQEGLDVQPSIKRLFRQLRC